MADVKISELPAASALSDADFAPLVQGGTTKRGTVAQLRAGLAVSGHGHAVSEVSGLQSALDARPTESGLRALRGQYSAEGSGRLVVDADHGRTLLYSGSAAATFTLPAGLAVGTLVVLQQEGTGRAGFAAASGATVSNLRNPGQLATAAQGAAIVAEQLSANSWRVSGDAAA